MNINSKEREIDEYNNNDIEIVTDIKEVIDIISRRGIK